MKEIRAFEMNELSANDESRRIEGYAAVFNSESVDLGGFVEIIDPKAFDGVLEQSDVLALLDHDVKRGVLARSNKGKGSLELTVDDRGLYFAFDAPKTALGDEVLEGVRRGDITGCSFSFVCGNDEWISVGEDKFLRRILSFSRIVDVSLVYSPAYGETSVNVVDKRGLDILKEQRNADVKDDGEREEHDEKPVVEEQPKDDGEREENEEQQPEQPVEENENPDEEREDDENEKPVDEQETPNNENEAEGEGEADPDDDNSEQRNITNSQMKKQKFSLINAINSVVNNRSFDEVTNGVIAEGRAAAAKSGISTNGSIVLPIEKRAEGDTPSTPTTPTTPNGVVAAGYDGLGKEAVPTETWDIEGALRDAMILDKIGVQYINVNGNVEIPVYNGANAYFESEIDEAQNTTGTFKAVKLAPKRVSAYILVSKTWLAQTSASAEAMLRNDLIAAAAERIQKQFFSADEGDDTKFAGIFADTTADTTNLNYKGIVDMESELESANVNGNYKYVVNPKAKAAMRVLSTDAGSGRFVWENDEILGTEAFSTNSVIAKGIAVGDWSNVVFGQFNVADITVDPYTHADRNQVKVVINMYVDIAVKRPEAIYTKIMK